ncbi:PREDICTED: uncharacterized protein LOC106810412 [Priapulus caudatus]|uniref:Uncharacterized protein LOC106810412 n=1 Tax=Priapulus caudatus TaxID=37621 RepID=A0ABM1EAM9_PRICU|nr:PREDICTED: uncharacterized protein LOC106810412 [Priapulus caudatus]
MLSVSQRHSRMKIILALLLFVCVTRCHGDESDYARPVSKCGPASPDPRSAVLCNFLLIAPRFMTMGTTQQVCMDFVRDSRIHLPAMNINILLKLSTNISESDVIASTQLHNQHVNGASLCADLELPDGEDYVYEQSAYLSFTAEESTFFHIADHKPVTLLRDIVKPFTFIEPDKPVYKPGQTVKFRILTLTKDLRPVAERLKDGCRKFDVDISDWPLRNHNYSHGTWRTVTLSLSANVTEDDTDVTLSGETEVKVSKNQLFLKFLSKDEFKPFLTYNAEVSATSLNGQPAAGVRIRLTVIFSETDQLVKTVVTGSDGVARLPIDLQLVKKQLSLKVIIFNC